MPSSLKGDRLSLPTATSDPSSAANGDMYFNTTLNVTKIYGSSGWTKIHEDLSIGTLNNPVTSSNINTFNGIGIAGDIYYVNSGSFNDSIEYSGANYKGQGRGYWLAWHGGHNTSQVSSILGQNFSFSHILIEAIGGPNTYHTMTFSSARTFNTQNSTGTASGGTKSGYRLYLGYAGGHGVYNTGQSVCNWGSSAGAFGSGFDGSCGSYPNSLRMGNGAAGTPYYNSYGGTWKFWISF